jgi:hypothetical protein
MIVFFAFVIFLVSYIGTGLSVHRWQPEIDALPIRLSAMAALAAAPLLAPFGGVCLLVAVGLFGSLLGFFGVALGRAQAKLGLTNILTALGYASAEQIDVAKSIQKVERHRLIEDVLVSLGYVTFDQVEEAFALQQKLQADRPKSA